MFDTPRKCSVGLLSNKTVHMRLGLPFTQFEYCRICYKQKKGKAGFSELIEGLSLFDKFLGNLVGEFACCLVSFSYWKIAIYCLPHTLGDQMIRI